LQVVRRAVPGHAAAGADQHEVVGERVVTRGRVPRRLADVLIEPARAGAPQLEAVVQPERESRAHEADELAVGEEPRGLDPGDACPAAARTTRSGPWRVKSDFAPSSSGAEEPYDQCSER